MLIDGHLYTKKLLDDAIRKLSLLCSNWVNDASKWIVRCQTIWKLWNLMWHAAQV